MSRILEALRRIEETVRDDLGEPAGADATDPRREEPRLPRARDANVDGVLSPGDRASVGPYGDASVSMPPIVSAYGDASVATPPGPAAAVETQLVYSFEQAVLQQDSARAGPGPDPRYDRLADLVVTGFPRGRRAVLVLTSPGTGEVTTRVAARLAEAISARGIGEALATDWDSEARQLAARLESGDGDAPRKFGRLVGLLEELRCNYQWVLLDAPSAACAETIGLARHCDGVLLVVELGRTGRRAAQRAVDLLQQSGANVLGCVAVGA